MSIEETPETPETDEIQSDDVETSVAPEAPIETQDGEPEVEADAEDPEKASKRKGYRERARTSRIEKENRELKEQLALRQVEERAPEITEPDQNDFIDYEKYLDARAEWKADQRFSELQNKADARAAERDRIAQATQIDARWEESQEDSRDRHEDFDDVINGEVNITPDMAAAVKITKGGGEIAYFLCKDLKESDRIARLPPLEQIMAIGAIGERLKERSTRPAPPKPVTRGRTSQSTSTNALNDNMSTKEWVAARNKQVGRA